MKILASYETSTLGNDTMVYKDYSVIKALGEYKIELLTSWSAYSGNDKTSTELTGSESDMQEQINEFVGEVIDDLQIWDIKEKKESEVIEGYVKQNTFNDDKYEIDGTEVDWYIGKHEDSRVRITIEVIE